MYQSYSGFTGLLVILAIVFVVFTLIFAAGSFLLGTPIGLAILAVIVVRHYWRRSLYLKAMKQAEAEWQQSAGTGSSGSGSGSGFGPFGAGAAQYTEQSGDPGVPDGVDRSEYSAAEDVNYKEIKE